MPYSPPSENTATVVYSHCTNRFEHHTVAVFSLGDATQRHEIFKQKVNNCVQHIILQKFTNFHEIWSWRLTLPGENENIKFPTFIMHSLNITRYIKHINTSTCQQITSRLWNLFTVKTVHNGKTGVECGCSNKVCGSSKEQIDMTSLKCHKSSCHCCLVVRISAKAYGKVTPTVNQASEGCRFTK